MAKRQTKKELLETIDGLKEDKARLVAENGDLVRSLERWKQAHASMSEEATRATREVDSLRRENSELKAQGDAAERARAQWQSQAVDLDAKRGSLEREIGSLTEERTEARCIAIALDDSLRGIMDALKSRWE